MIKPVSILHKVPLTVPLRVSQECYNGEEALIFPKNYFSAIRLNTIIKCGDQRIIKSSGNYISQETGCDVR